MGGESLGEFVGTIDLCEFAWAVYPAGACCPHQSGLRPASITFYGIAATGSYLYFNSLRDAPPKGKLISPGLLKIRGIAFIFFSNYPFTDPAVTPLMMKRDRKMYTARTGRMASKMNIYTLPKSNLE